MQILSKDETGKFLISAANQAKGDINKNLQINEIVKKENITNIEDIISELINYNFIKKNDDLSFKVTRQGFYYVIEFLEKIPYKLNMERYEVAEMLAIQIIQRTLSKGKEIIKISEIEDGITLGEIILQQIIEILENNGFAIKIDSDNLKITNEGIILAIKNFDR